MPTLGDQSLEESAQLLEDFLWRLERLLARVVREPHGIIPEVLHAELRAAWVEVQPNFQVARGSLPQVIELLPRAGLSGSELRLKMTAVEWATGRLDRAWRRARHTGGRALGKVAGLFASVLGLVDVPLDSLSTLIPLEAIKEFKGVVEHGADLVSKVADEELWEP